MTAPAPDVDRALTAAEADIRSAVVSLGLAGDQLRLATAGLPEHPLTGEQTLRYYVLVAAVAVARRALVDALAGRTELGDVVREVARTIPELEIK